MKDCSKNYLFAVLDKENLTFVKVYDVRNDSNGFPNFLIYSNGQWKYVSAKHFKAC